MAPVTCQSITYHSFFDTGSAVNLIKLDVFKQLLASAHISTCPSDVNLHGISGQSLHIHGKAFLSLSLSPAEPDVCDFFYIVSNVTFHADILIGLATMEKYNIHLYPSSHTIAQGNTYISTVSSSPVLSHTIASVTSVAQDSLSTASSSPATQLPSPSSCDQSLTTVKRIRLDKPVSLPGCVLAVVTAKVDSAVSGSDLLCCAQQSPCHGIQLESILSTVDESGSCLIALRNMLPTPRSLKKGVELGEVHCYPSNIQIMDDFPSLPVSHVSHSDNSASHSLPPITRD